MKEFLLDENADIAAFEKINFFRKEQPKENIDHIWKYPYMEYTPENVLSTIYFPGASGIHKKQLDEGGRVSAVGAGYLELWF